jgi:hypothetical protein
MSDAHETAMALIDRAKAEIERGRGVAKNAGQSPGQKESRMAAEFGHDGGRGNTRSNAPGSFGGADPAVDVHDQSRGPSQENMTGTGPVRSDGHIHSNLTGAHASSGVVDIRRMAGLKALESKESSGGNAHSNTPPGPAERGTKMTNVKSPAASPSDTNKGKEFEGGPPIAKENISGDGWSRAREKTKAMIAKR